MSGRSCAISTPIVPSPRSRGVRKRQGRTVECSTFNLAVGPHEEFNTLNRNVGTELRDKHADRAVAAIASRPKKARKNRRMLDIQSCSRAARGIQHLE